LKTYRCFNPILIPYVQNGAFVTLRQAAGYEDKRLPARDLLDTHFRLCEIWHASSFAEQVEYNTERWDRMKQEAYGGFLQEDGSTDLAKFLQTAFSSVVQCV
jgi:hypothetical protein